MVVVVIVVVAVVAFCEQGRFDLVVNTMIANKPVDYGLLNTAAIRIGILQAVQTAADVLGVEVLALLTSSTALSVFHSGVRRIESSVNLLPDSIEIVHGTVGGRGRNRLK